jgi:hypothetical protein
MACVMLCRCGRRSGFDRGMLDRVDLPAASDTNRACQQRESARPNTPRRDIVMRRHQLFMLATCNSLSIAF